ncbi:M28 family peptidase [Epilithonimonas lactis]|uniref:Leucyl aminopeptidase n=1 Tax=Epilithonimonas lactis TaxID=421072 RepID=A0A085BIG8_9FLAO|nr:M28 family peptidase [Epilithonimonas lactis]KFC22263.1 leucyl aminopeptidase [Epilithonimonas lactis]SEQ59780.1 Por secretion system C-terminal sorting domain-containing protein [Epilithonimonas lactis]
MFRKYISSLVLLATIHFAEAQTFIQAYQNRANQVSQSNVNTYLQEFEALGVKRTGTTQNTNAFNWIKNKYTSFGYNTAHFQEHSWTANGLSSKNFIVTKTGTLYPNKFVIVCGHFDSINGPGTNDNGSGTSIILEIARILKDIPTEYSIKFIHFSGEEQGLLGSSRYVSEIVNGTSPKMDIKVVVNLDQVGGLATKANTKLYHDKDQSAPNSNNAAAAIAVQELANCTTLYSPLGVDFDPAESTDYVPFQQNGEIITGYWEFEGGYSNPYVHTANDLYVNMDPVYVFNVGKAAVGAIQHFAVASTSILAVEDISLSKILESVEFYPNPAKNTLNLKMDNPSKAFTFELTDMSGSQILINKKNAHQIDISHLKAGVYLGTITIDSEKVTKKIIIE